MIETLKLALREVVETAERRALAQRALDDKTRVTLDDRGATRYRDPSAAPAQAQALLLADLQYESALAHARNVLAAADDVQPPYSADDVARIRRAVEMQRNTPPTKPCRLCGVVGCTNEHANMR